MFMFFVEKIESNLWNEVVIFIYVFNWKISRKFVNSIRDIM